MKKRVIIGCLSLLAVALCLWAALSLGCPIRKITGIPCPACGTTRALLAFVYGDIRAAFAYHPLFPAAIMSMAGLFAYIILRLTGKLTARAEKYFAFIALIILLLYIFVYIIRLMFFI